MPPEMRHVIQQQHFLQSKKRFNIAPCGRRSGKSMTSKVRGFRRALTIPYADGRVVFAAPTHRQAKRVFWRDVKRMFKPFTLGKPMEGELSLTLCNGVIVEVIGLDVPERIEGAPLDHINLDEYANMKAKVWTDHIAPMLSERNGTADLTGTPDGRNHYYYKYLDAIGDDDWGAFTWTSEQVLPQAEVERLKRDLDPQTYAQECEASFLNFEGQAYYSFNIDDHVKPTEYNPSQPLILCIDFNAKPGNCSILQEHPIHGTQVLDEVFLQRYSNTKEVIEHFLESWGKHPTELHLYGDPAGNQRKSSNVAGTDWQIVEDTLATVFFSRAKNFVPRSAPGVRDSVNCTNSRIASGSFRVDPKCKWMIRDLEGSERDSRGDLLKTQGELLTHLTDGLRYYIAETFPIQGYIGSSVSIM